MDENDSYPEIDAEVGDGDEVEILEVVGVDDVGRSAHRGPADEPEDEEPAEYLLDFDDPEEDSLAATAAAAGVVEAEDPAESDAAVRQRLVRLRADYDNLRRRSEREREEFELHANGELVGRLLPVMDNLERALAANASSDPKDPLREGLVMIHRQLSEQLSQAGLRPIDAVGRPFDPNLHDAFATESSSDHPANTVLEEMQRGYLFQDKVLRPALVKVSTGNGEPGEDA
jgi:molecular chaperone GrpE